MASSFATIEDGQTVEYLHLDAGEHAYMVRLRMARGSFPYWVGATNETRATAQAKEDAALDKSSRGRVLSIEEVKQDDGYLCAHCGRVGGH